MKRFFDILFSFVLMLLLAPVFILVAVAIKADSPGPIFYRGVRVGRDGIPFQIYKFRSMVTNAEILGSSSTSNSDSRVTRVGNIIRKFKLDEFSQLINVFLGDMSVVGPRPQVQWAVDNFSPMERRVLQLRPGITDWASIKFHDEGEIIEKSGIVDPDEAYMKLIHPEKMRLQLVYLENHSCWIDLKIIFKTVSTLFATRISQANE